MCQIKCAFCKGTGHDPFDLLSKLAECQVCGGSGKVYVEEPYVKCPDCKGRGVCPHTRNTCIACGGKGVVNAEKQGGEKK